MLRQVNEARLSSSHHCPSYFWVGRLWPSPRLLSTSIGSLEFTLGLLQFLESQKFNQLLLDRYKETDRIVQKVIAQRSRRVFR